jgi:nitroimidazol reductase NimA-like FMN-containing flavoprotein (pyridoxamine 5'-phosphate oxidase superfamily)
LLDKWIFHEDHLRVLDGTMSDLTTFPPQSVGRHPERARSERDALDAVLDASLVGTLSTVVDGRPWVVPMLYARVGDRVLVHGSTGAGALRAVAAGAPVALCVAVIDGLVVAHTTFESSANYRSAVVSGTLERLSGAEQEAALDLLSERLVPGRTSEVRSTTKKERAQTLAMALPIVDGLWTVKVRDAWSDVPDEETDAWIGIVPMRTVYDPPQTAPFSPVGAPVPASVHALVESNVTTPVRA